MFAVGAMWTGAWGGGGWGDKELLFPPCRLLHACKLPQRILHAASMFSEPEGNEKVAGMEKRSLPGPGRQKRERSTRNDILGVVEEAAARAVRRLGLQRHLQTSAQAATLLVPVNEIGMEWDGQAGKGMALARLGRQG